ncbi:hypothetical protein H311_02169 [Anncaliia algerae PRA109]
MNFERERAQTLFSSDGKLEQCDNALKAAINGTLSVGACANDGVVLASLKQFSPLVDKEKVRKVFKVCDSIGITYSGLQPDFRIVYEEASKLVEDYKDVYGRYPFVDVFTSYLSRVLQEYTQKGGFRPFGVMILVCGPMLKKSETADIIKNHEVISGMFQMDPSGSFQAINAGAIGKEYQEAVKRINNRLELTDDNLVTCLGTLKNLSGTKVDVEDVDIGVFRLKDSLFHTYSTNEVKELFESLNF